MATFLGAIKGNETKSALIGEKTKFYTDVRVPVKAGMEFGTRNYKIRTIGYDVFRHYFDNANKDWQVGSQRIKRVIK
jgi:hypothetical protein